MFDRYILKERLTVVIIWSGNWNEHFSAQQRVKCRSSREHWNERFIFYALRLTFFACKIKENLWNDWKNCVNKWLVTMWGQIIRQQSNLKWASIVVDAEADISCNYLNVCLASLFVDLSVRFRFRFYFCSFFHTLRSFKVDDVRMRLCICFFKLTPYNVNYELDTVILKDKQQTIRPRSKRSTREKEKTTTERTRHIQCKVFDLKQSKCRKQKCEAYSKTFPIFSFHSNFLFFLSHFAISFIFTSANSLASVKISSQWKNTVFSFTCENGDDFRHNALYK